MSPEPLRRPSELGGGLPTIEFHEWADPVYRIQDEGPISSQRHPRPRYRFDAPGGEYAVLYANDTKVATFNESYAEKRRRIPKADAKKEEITEEETASTSPSACRRTELKGRVPQTQQEQR